MRRLLPIAILILLVGCSGEAMRQVTVPASQPTTRSQTDTLRLPAVPPVPEPGAPTQPIEVQIHRDTLPGPELQVKRLTVDRRTDDPGVTLQYQTGGRTLTDRYELPSYGEALDIFPEQQSVKRYGEGRPRSDTVRIRDTVVVPRVQVRGTPQDREVKATVPEEDEGLGAWISSRLAWLGGLVLLGGALYALRTFTNLLPW